MLYKQFSTITNGLDIDFVEEFDFWLATLPRNKEDNITVSSVASRFGVPFSLAKYILEFSCDEKIMDKHYLIKCSDEDCEMALESIEISQLPKFLSEPVVFCNNCFEDRTITPDNIFIVYRRITKPDIPEEELNLEILKRLSIKGSPENFNAADSLSKNKKMLYESYYSPDESAYKKLESMFFDLDRKDFGSTTEKGASFEALALYLFRLIDGVKGTNKIKTFTNQFDCTISYPYTHCFPTILNFLTPYFIVECKNEEKGAPSNTYFHKLSSIMTTNEAQVGMIFSRNPASDEDIAISHQQYLLSKNTSNPKFLIDISDQDLNMVIKQRINLLEYLDFKLLKLTTNSKNASFEIFTSSDGKRID